MSADKSKSINKMVKTIRKMKSGKYFLVKREGEYHLPFAVERGERLDFRHYIYDAVRIEDGGLVL